MCDTSSESLAGLADQLGWAGLLTATVDGLMGCSTDELSEDELAATMRVVQTEQTRLGNLQALLFDARSRRAVLRGRDAAGGDANAGVRAVRQLEQDVAGELGIGNGEAKRIARAGRAITRDPDAARAAKDGTVSAEHLRVLDEKLRDLDDLEVAGRLRRELVAKAAELPLPAFRRACDRAIAQADAAAASRAEDRKQSRRSAKTFQTDDGMLGVSARLSGIDAETVATALDAYRRPDAADQRRRPEQRTADALVDLATVALRHVGSTAHGHPPQILLVVDRTDLTGLLGRADQTRGGTASDTVANTAGATLRHATDDANHRSTGTCAGVVESVWCGPLPASEATLIQAQARVTLIARGGGRPTYVTTHTRRIPTGLWPLLVARDRGCVADGCDVPAGWCDIVHLHVDHQPGGRLSEANAALVCRRHHRAYDHPTRPLVAIWTDDRPVLVRHDRIPDRSRRTPPDHLTPPDGLQGPVPGRPVPVIDPATRRPTGRWLPPAPDDESATDDSGDGTRVTTGHADALEAPCRTSDHTGGTSTDRSGRDDHRYRRDRTAGQPSLLAEPRAGYRSGVRPATARPCGPTDRSEPTRARPWDRPRAVTRRASEKVPGPAHPAAVHGWPDRPTSRQPQGP